MVLRVRKHNLETKLKTIIIYNSKHDKSRNLNILLAYKRVMVSDCDVVASRTRTPCLYLKNDVLHGLSISKNTRLVTLI